MAIWLAGCYILSRTQGARDFIRPQRVLFTSSQAATISTSEEELMNGCAKVCEVCSMTSVKILMNGTTQKQSMWFNISITCIRCSRWSKHTVSFCTPEFQLDADQSLDEFFGFSVVLTCMSASHRLCNFLTKQKIWQIYLTLDTFKDLVVKTNPQFSNKMSKNLLKTAHPSRSSCHINFSLSANCSGHDKQGSLFKLTQMSVKTLQMKKSYCINAHWHASQRRQHLNPQIMEEY